MIHYKQLRAFVAIVEQGSFSKAAQKLYITQPAISLQIKTLETELGLVLIERRDREIALTPAGLCFFENAKVILNQYHTLNEDLNQFRTEMNTQLRIAASTIPGEYLLPEKIKAFKKIHPDLTISMAIYDSVEVLNQVIKDEFSIGIIGFKPSSQEIQSEIFVTEKLKLVGQSQSETHNFPSTLKELLKKPHILREEGSGTRKTVLEYLKTHGIDLSQINLSVDLGSTKSTLTAVEVGLGLSWISEHALEDALKLNKVKLIEDQFDIERTFYIITRRKKTLNPLAQQFKDYLVQRF